ncbi:MAG: insulinase family protein, partial [Gemmataceae bacterium]|nr:insulinase family protein [Gemmataceae bacterium]
KEDTQENLELLTEVLTEVQRDGVTAEEIQQAKNKLGSYLVRANERPMNRMLAIGSTWTYLKQYRTVDDDLQAIDAVTPETIRTLLREYPLTQLTVVAHGPLDKLEPPSINGQ